MSEPSLPVPDGVIPIVVTPFDASGSVDVAQFDRQLDFLCSTGVRWVGFGFGSEVQRLAVGELSALMSRAVAFAGDTGGARGDLRVVGNAEVTGVATGVDAVRRVADAGADAAMVRPAGMTGVPEAAAAAVIADVAAKGGLPVVVQDAPQNTGVDLTAGSLAGLMIDVPEIVGVKVESVAAAAKIGTVTEALAGLPGAVLGGLGGQDFWQELRRGAAGTMPGPAFPDLFAAVRRRHEAGDDKGAFDLWARALPLVLFCLTDPETFLVAQKYLLTRRGVLDGHLLRRPHRDPGVDLIADIDAFVDHVLLWDLLDECRE